MQEAPHSVWFSGDGFLYLFHACTMVNMQHIAINHECRDGLHACFLRFANAVLASLGKMHHLKLYLVSVNNIKHLLFGRYAHGTACMIKNGFGHKLCSLGFFQHDCWRNFIVRSPNYKVNTKG